MDVEELRSTHGTPCCTACQMNTVKIFGPEAEGACCCQQLLFERNNSQ